MEPLTVVLQALSWSAVIGPVIGVTLLFVYVYLRFKKKKNYRSLLWLGIVMLLFAAILFLVVLYLGIAKGGFTS